MWRGKAISKKIIFYIHSQSCNSFVMFALFINNKNFEVSDFILESKLLLKLFFARKTSEIILLPLILRTKSIWYCNSCGFSMLPSKWVNRKWQHACVSTDLIYTYNGLSKNQLFAYSNNMNEICPKTRRLFWLWVNAATLIHIRNRSYIFLRAEWT